MAHLVESLSQFLIFISIGSVYMFPVVKLEDTGIGFGKLTLAISFFSFMASIVLWLYSPMVLNPLVNFSYLLALIFLIAVNYLIFQKKEKVLPLNKIFYLIFVLISCLLIYQYNDNHLLSSVYTLASIIFVGCSVFLMFLGHYYLVVPKLSEKPLLVLHYILWGIFFIKFCFSIFSYFRWSEGSLELWDQVFIWMRFLWGYLAIGVLSYFSFRLSKMRSTQSATGILYVIVFFMIVGELISYYFHNSKGLYI